MTGVTNDAPEPTGVPPVAAAYQLKVDPALPVAPSVTVPGPQRVAGVVVSTCGLLTLTVSAGCTHVLPAASFISSL